MVPEQFVQMDEFPRTATGKIDRKIIELVKSTSKQEIDFQNNTEEQLTEFWTEILQHSDFGPHDQFLLIGGNSLKLSQLHLMINELYPDIISVQDLFDYSSIRALAKLINERVSTSNVEEKISSDIEF